MGATPLPDSGRIKSAPASWNRCWGIIATTRSPGNASTFRRKNGGEAWRRLNLTRDNQGTGALGQRGMTPGSIHASVAAAHGENAPKNGKPPNISGRRLNSGLQTREVAARPQKKKRGGGQGDGGNGQTAMAKQLVELPGPLQLGKGRQGGKDGGSNSYTARHGNPKPCGEAKEALAGKRNLSLEQPIRAPVSMINHFDRNLLNRNPETIPER